VPICWPWFGAHPTQADLPAHGYVRAQNWLIQTPEQTHNGLLLTLTPENSDIFHLGLHLKLELLISHQLSMRLITTNTGEHAQKISAAMHNYFAIQDINCTQLSGLETEYLDKLDANIPKPAPMPYQLNGETDRIHLKPAGNTDIVCPGFTTSLLSSGHDSLVVWNPWQQKAQAMPDMGADSYRSMICVETAHTQGLTLPPGQSHSLTQHIS